MFTAVFIISLVILCILSFEDFKRHAISWYYLPILFVLLFIASLQYLSFKALLISIALNLVIIAFIYLMLVLYFSVKNRKIIFNINQYLGIGDTLFILCLLPSFSAINYVFYLVFGLFVALILGLIYQIRTKQKEIPLVGFLGIYYSIIFVINKFIVDLNLLEFTNYFFNKWLPQIL